MSELRIELTDYRPYIEMLQDKLNEDGIYKMSMTDAVKIAINNSRPYETDAIEVAISIAEGMDNIAGHVIGGIARLFDLKR